MFGLKLKLFSKKDDIVQTAKATRRMYVHCGDLGWEGRVVDPADPEAGERFAEMVPLGVDGGDKALDEAFRLAGNKITARDAKQIQDVFVLTDDPAIHYSDMLADAFKAASVASLREIGGQSLGSVKVTFGQVDLQPAVEGLQTRQRQVIAWADIKRAGMFLTRLNHLAPSVRALVPVADVLVGAVARPGEGAGAALYLGAHSSRFVMVNADLGAVLVRTPPIGIVTLIRKVAEESGISLEEAERTLSTSDYLSSIRLDLTDTMARSQIERILGADLRRLVSVIREAIEFFDTQRSSGTPASIQLFGDLGRIKGLEALIRASLPVPLEPSPVSVFEAFCASSLRPHLNLLKHVGNDLRIGAIAYGFREDRLIPASRATQEPSRVDQQASRVQHRVRPQGRRRLGTPARPASGGGLFDGLLAKLRPGAAFAPSEADGEVSPARRDMMWAAAFGGLAAITLAMGYNNFSDAGVMFHNRTGAAVDALDNNRRLREALGRIQQQVSSEELGADKVLWAEKFLAIAKTGVMDEGVWLTDVFLTTEQHSGGAPSAAANKKLVLQGAVLPSTVGHIQHIADYIRKLQEQTNFMSDFREVDGLTFEGAHIETSDSDSIIRFGLDAWYDESRRAPTRAAAATGGNASLAKTMSAEEQRKQENAKALVTNATRN